MKIDFYKPTIENIEQNQPTSTILSKKLPNPVKYSKFGEDLILFEKGQLTIMPGEFYSSLSIFDTKETLTVPHTNMPWILYKESYRRIPLVYNAVNNTADFALQADFELDGSTDATERIWRWMDKVNFPLIILDIFKAMQIFGNAYLDISDINFPKLLAPEQMFVVVKKGGDDDGKIIGYKQVISFDEKKNINFTADELIHFKWNAAIHPFYGMSEIHPALGPITRYENWQLDLGQILHRYAAPIIHWILGTNDFPATEKQITDFKGTLENRLPGEDIITSTAVNQNVVAAGQKMMQVDGLIKALENQIISALRIPEVFARGGESSNKATATIELEAFDRKVKAIQKSVSAMLEDFLFPKITSGKVSIIWNELSAEGELQRTQRINLLVTSGIPVNVALKMVGLGTWVEDVKKAIKEKETKEKEIKPLIIQKNKPDESQTGYSQRSSEDILYKKIIPSNILKTKVILPKGY